MTIVVLDSVGNRQISRWKEIFSCVKQTERVTLADRITKSSIEFHVYPLERIIIVLDYEYQHTPQFVTLYVYNQENFDKFLSMAYLESYQYLLDNIRGTVASNYHIAIKVIENTNWNSKKCIFEKIRVSRYPKLLLKLVSDKFLPNFIQYKHISIGEIDEID